MVYERLVPAGRLWPRNDGVGVAPGRIYPPFHIPEQSGPLIVRAIYDVSDASIRPQLPIDVVGQPPWGDDSDASWCDLYADYNFGFHLARIATATTNLPSVNIAYSGPIEITVRVRIQGLESGLPMPSFAIRDAGDNVLMSGSSDVVVPSEPTWIDVPLGPGTPETFAALSVEQGANIYVAAPFFSVPGGDYVRRTWRTYEVEVEFVRD